MSFGFTRNEMLAIAATGENQSFTATHKTLPTAQQFQ